MDGYLKATNLLLYENAQTTKEYKQLYWGNQKRAKINVDRLLLFILLRQKRRQRFEEDKIMCDCEVERDNQIEYKLNLTYYFISRDKWGTFGKSKSYIL